MYLRSSRLQNIRTRTTTTIPFSSPYSVVVPIHHTYGNTVPSLSPLAYVASTLSSKPIPYHCNYVVRWNTTVAEQLAILPSTENKVTSFFSSSSSTTTVDVDTKASIPSTINPTITTVLSVPDKQENKDVSLSSTGSNDTVYIKRSELRGLISSLQRISKDTVILQYIKSYSITKNVWNDFLNTYSKQLQDMVKVSLQRSEEATANLLKPLSSSSSSDTTVPTTTQPHEVSADVTPSIGGGGTVPGSNNNQNIHFISLPSSYRALVDTANKVNIGSSQKLSTIQESMKELTTLLLMEAGIVAALSSSSSVPSSSSSSSSSSPSLPMPASTDETKYTNTKIKMKSIDVPQSSSSSKETSTSSPSMENSHRQRHPVSHGKSSSLSSTKSSSMRRPGSTAASKVPELASLSSLRDLADLRHPHLWYPAARAMRRRIIYHAGPTNSGKTYNALVALKEAYSGIYAGPLRLLALEVFESLNQEGTYCSLMTGQEKRSIPFARHISATVEMVDVERLVDVAVIDEIQMIGDETRGAAWTRAVLGVPAKEIHLCGDPAAIPAIKALTDITKDEFIIKEYNRLTAMTPEETSLQGNYGKIEEGDAVVAFSRKDIYAIRKSIERSTNHKCCVVYGSLPPETRSAQARLFNDPNSGYRVLVASDAIGMGLNLNIRRVVFHTMQKFDGTSVGQMVPSMVKQIAGRAGRRNSIYPAGFSTTLNETDVGYLHTCLATPTTPIEKNGLFPNPEQLIAFSALLPYGTPLSRIVESFLAASTLEGPYFMCRGEDFRTMADVLQPYSLPLELRAQLLLAPINLRNIEIKSWYTSFIEQYAKGGPVRLHLQLPLYTMENIENDPVSMLFTKESMNSTTVNANTTNNNNSNELSISSSIWAGDIETLEAKAAALDIYVWLAYRLGNYTSFPDVNDALIKRSIVSNLLENGLMRISDDAKELQKRTLRWKHSMDREIFGEDEMKEKNTTKEDFPSKIFRKGKDLSRSAASGSGIRTRRNNSIFGIVRA